MGVKWCIVKGCPNSFCKTKTPPPTVKIFGFPSNKIRKTEWIDILNIDREVVSNVQCIGVCQRHFVPVDIIKTKHFVRLSKDAIPSLFLNVLPPHLQVSNKANLPEVENQTENIKSNIEPANHSSPNLKNLKSLMSTPFGGEFLKYLESNNKKRETRRNFDVNIGPIEANPLSSPSGFLIKEIEQLDEEVNNASSTISSTVVDEDKPKETEEISSRQLTSPLDFNLDLFDDVDPKEIEQYKTHFPKLEKIADSKTHCTSCQYHIGTAPINEAFIKMHPILRVTQCKKCFTFYNSGEFERGEDGSELYCRWCGQGGEVYCCSNCPYVFCRRCIVQNLSRNMVTEIQNNENWNCFACAPQCMIPLRANHWALVNFIEKQKRQIATISSDEKEMNELMSNDISKCCSGTKKRITLKRKVENNTAVITPPPEKKKSIAPSSSPKLLSTKKPNENKPTSEDDDSVDVQCTPDILSLFNNDEQTSSSTVEAPPLRLIRREVTIRPNQTGTSRLTVQETPLPKQPTPPPKLITPPLPAIQAPTPLSVNTPTTSNPVYHTINGFRIDLNTAAQQETYRLPNGKLIQVKKQTPNVTQPSSTPPERSQPIISRPPVQAIPSRLPGLPPNRPHVSARSSVGGVIRPPFQVQQRQPIQLQTRFVGNNQIRIMNGPIIQQLNATPPPMTPSHPPPLVFRTGHGNSPVGKARTQFEERVDNSMEICQHIIGKINTLTNSSSYKKVRSLMDLKDLTIHLSYLLTYAIGRFKTLQEKCIEDMKNMGFDPENAKGATSDDDIEIVEPKTTTINLDSDEEDEASTAVNNIPLNTNLNVQMTPVTNGEPNIAASHDIQESNLDGAAIGIENGNIEGQEQTADCNTNIAGIELIDVFDEPMDTAEEIDRDKNVNNNDQSVQVEEITEKQTTTEVTHENKLVEDLASSEIVQNNNKIQEQNSDNIDNVVVDLNELPDKPLGSGESTEGEKTTEIIENTEEDIVQVVVIAENSEDENKNTENDDISIENNVESSIDAKENNKKTESDKPNELDKISNSTENTTEIVDNNKEVTEDKVQSKEEEANICESEVNVSDVSKSKKNETDDDVVPIECLDKIETKMKSDDDTAINDVISEIAADEVVKVIEVISKKNIDEDVPVTISESLTDKVDDVTDAPMEIIDESIPKISDEKMDEITAVISENIIKISEAFSFDNIPTIEPPVNENTVVSTLPLTPEKVTVENLPSNDIMPNIAEDNITEDLFGLSGSTITDENLVKSVTELFDKNIVDEIPAASGNSIFAIDDVISKEKIVDGGQIITGDDTDNYVAKQISSIPEKNIVNAIEPAADISDVPEESITDAISDMLSDKLTDNICLPDDIDDNMCESAAGDDSSTLLDDIIMKTLELDASV